MAKDDDNNIDNVSRLIISCRAASWASKSTQKCPYSIQRRVVHINVDLKTAFYTNVNGDMVSYTSKTAKIKRGDITQQHIAKCQRVTSPPLT